MQSLAAHELAHVIRRERSSAAARYGWLVGYLALVIAGAGLTVAALVAAPQLAGAALLATMSAAVAFLALQVAFDRREEIAADRFAVGLTRDLEAAAELMRFYEDNVAKPLPADGSRPTPTPGPGWQRCADTWSTTRPTSCSRPSPRLLPVTAAPRCSSARPRARAGG